MTNQEKINMFRKELESAKADLNKYEGSMEMLLKRLKDEFGIATIADAEKRLVALDKQIEETERILAEKITYIETHYEFSV